MSYEIRTYKEEYLEKQVEIGSSILSNWLGAQQTGLEALRKAYSNENFDPETKFYAFRNNEMVGFLTAGIKDTTANMEFPVVLSNHQDAEKLLIEAAYSSFKEKGLSQVVSRASPTWGKTLEFVKEYGYAKKNVLWISSRLDIADFESSLDNTDTESVNIENDYEGIKEILIKFREMTPEGVDSYFKSLKKINERITSWKVIRRDGKIVGHDILVQDKFDSKKARMNAIYAVTHESNVIEEKIMKAHVDEAKKTGILYIDNFFWGPTEKLATGYEKYGFLISDVTAYVKDL